MEVQIQNPELVQFINDQVSLGNYRSPEAVVEEALLRMRMEEEVEEAELTDEDVAAIKISDEQIARGEVIDSEEAKRQIRQLYRKGNPGEKLS